jgi:hypothetical protein
LGGISIQRLKASTDRPVPAIESALSRLMDNAARIVKQEERAIPKQAEAFFAPPSRD